MSDHRDLRLDLAASYRRLGELGLNELSAGNLSARVDGGMLVSASGASPEAIEPGQFVFVADRGWDPERDGGPDGLRPSSEWQMHLAVYQRHRSAGAVVHTHSDHCVALAAHGRPLPGFTYVVGSFGGPDVPCVPYHTFGTEALAQDAAAALAHRTACLLGNHGMLARARNLSGAVDAAQRLELLCRQYLAACQLGEPAVLTAQEWDEFFAQAAALRYGQPPKSTEPS